jgi:hypothetical protein
MSTAIDLTTIEHLDFSETLPCEHEGHRIWHPGDEPASIYIKRLDCPHCGYVATPRVLALCLPAWVAAGHGALQCPACRKPDVRDVFWRYLGPINDN